jgi:DNA-binding MarR family transcriptional regulator
MSTDEPTDFGLLLARAFNAYVGHLHDRLAEAGFDDLRPTFGLPLRALHEAPRTTTELAAQLGVTKQAAGKVVGEMERRGLIERVPSPTDGRAVVLRLSPRGTALVREAVRIGTDVEHDLGADAARGLRPALERLAYDPPWEATAHRRARRVW